MATFVNLNDLPVEYNFPRSRVLVRQAVKNVSPYWLFPTLVTFFIAMIAAVALSSLVLNFHLILMEASMSRINNKVATARSDIGQLRASVKRINTQLKPGLESLRRLEAADAEQRERLAAVKCALERHLQNRTEGCCPLKFKMLQDSCYFISRQALSWSDSRLWCQSQQSQLLILSSDQDWNFVQSYGLHYWVGLSDTSGTWKWVDDTSYTMDTSHWHPRQPDNTYGKEDCAHLNQGRLNDLHCGNKLPFICKKTAQ